MINVNVKIKFFSNTLLTVLIGLQIYILMRFIMIVHEVNIHIHEVRSSHKKSIAFPLQH
jgi:hypothetical protein